ncbi:coiled-coil domain-containing protein 50-like isoform X2 [Polyodon spathula]|uniref:coiled-coil domain-containing protein 50-like isoform X2 n=1 Tax=Polyodon spathula TaxID=7913 RepID=UPI001B7DFB5F|nr:coiled-coil domain-containing protein 50-like isoform X2 [Polyodon spathula]
MADLSIDKKKLPGVKEVCRDFAVLEDHTLAHNLQEQEIENHLASNIQKSRLVQYDLQVAKRMQDEEDKRAWARNQRRQRDIVHSDNEIAQVIQEQLVKQALNKRQQEKKDEAIARRLHEKELKEERKRKKQLQDVPFEDGYYAENGGMKPQGEYGLQEVMQGVTRLDLRGSELTDLEVALRLQEEELKATNLDKRAAQMAQDEEIARLLMEKEKRLHIRSRDREKGTMETRRQEPELKPEPGEAVRPRSREGYELQRPRTDKPARPPRPVGDYENIDASYGNTSSPCSPRPSSRSDAVYKGSYSRQ